jgi:uncharacterized protein
MLPSVPRNVDEIPRGAWDAKARLEYMDSQSLWAQVIYPNVGGFGNQAFLTMDDLELRIACVRAYNDWLVEWCSADSRRLIPIAAMPFWDVEAAAAEVERAAAIGHRGVLFSGEPQRFGLPVLGDRHWDPLWSAAQDAGLPISFHIGTGDFSIHFKPERVASHGFTATAARSVVALFLDNAVQVADLLLSGALARYPDLKFVSVESGVGWVPFVLETADYAFVNYRVREERPDLEMLPSEYFLRQVYGCFFFEEVCQPGLLDRIGSENLLFETDYPHPICLYDNVQETVERSMGVLPEDVRHNLVWANAAKLYGVAPAE